MSKASTTLTIDVAEVTLPLKLTIQSQDHEHVRAVSDSSLVSFHSGKLTMPLQHCIDSDQVGGLIELCLKQELNGPKATSLAVESCSKHNFGSGGILCGPSGSGDHWIGHFIGLGESNGKPYYAVVAISIPNSEDTVNSIGVALQSTFGFKD